MSSTYPHVFSPIQIGPVEVKNRFYFSPHGNPLFVGRSPSADSAYYFAERAAGGVGLIIHSLRVIRGGASPWEAETIPSFAALAGLVHENGAKIFGQLHFGYLGPPAWEPLAPAAPFLGSSVYQRFDHYAVSRAMRRPEIDLFVETFRQSAAHLAQAGYDGIEVHCTHGILAEQFLSPYWNKRTDEYGGGLDGRMRLLIQLLRAAREGAGPELAVGIRFNCDEMLPGGWDQDDAKEILERLVALELIDFADLDIAVEPNQFPLGMPPYFVPQLTYESFVAEVRTALGSVPVLSALARVTSVADAERVIADGTVDLVGAARGLIAEPELVKHAAEGREHESRVCIACNWCLAAGHALNAFGCAINPGSARERRWGVRTLAPTNARSKVVVVGGGPAGLEAARVAALRGHEVVLMERRAIVGGQMMLWSKLPERGVFAETPAWWERQLTELGVDVRKNVAATATSILAEDPDTVIVATGATYARDGESGFIALPIPGHERDLVYSPEQIIEGGARPTGKVLILDDEGLNTGVGIAELLASSGAQVELITRWLQPAENLLFTLEFAFVIPRLKNLDVKLSTQTYVKEIGDHSVTVFDAFTNAETRIEGVDAVVLATMRRPEPTFEDELEHEVEQLYVIGDALAPRGLAEATYEGQKFARMIGDPEAARNFAEAFFAKASADVYPAPAASITVASIG